MPVFHFTSHELLLWSQRSFGTTNPMSAVNEAFVRRPRFPAGREAQDSLQPGQQRSLVRRNSGAQLLQNLDQSSSNTKSRTLAKAGP